MSKKFKYSKSLVLTNGKRKNIRSNSKQEFQKKVADAQREIGVGIDICDQTTVVELIQTWFDVQKKPFIRETSQETLRQTINYYCLPEWFARKRVRDVSPADISKIMASVASFHRDTQSKVLQVLKGSFQFAVDNDIILKSPVRDTHKARGDKAKEVIPLTAQQCVDLMDATEGTRAYVPICLMLGCGLRRGEVCGLLWKDIDFVNSVLHVRHTVVLNCGIEQFRDVTKTDAGIRDIPIPQWLLEILQEEHRTSTSKFVTSKLDGSHHTQGSWRRLWDIVVHREIDSATPNDKHTDCPRVLDFHCHPHQLRHTCITRWVEDGLDFKEVQYLAGHSTIDMTLQVYAHYDKKSRFEETKSRIKTMNPYENGVHRNQLKICHLRVI